MYHGQFIIIHQKVWGCMKKKHSNGWKKKKHTNGIELMVLGLYLFAKLYRKQSLAEVSPLQCWACQVLGWVTACESTIASPRG